MNLRTDKKTRVIFAINDFTLGGAQRLDTDLFRHMDAEKFEPTLLTFFELPHRKDMYGLVPGHVKVVRLGMKGFFDVHGWGRAYRALKEARPDVVVTSLFFSNTVTRILKPFFGYKCAVVEQNTYIFKSKAFVLIDRLLSRWTDSLVATSETVADFTAKQESIDRARFKVIHSGVDAAAIKALKAAYPKREMRRQIGVPDDAKIILNVSRLTPQKNQALLLQSFAEFSKRHPEYFLVIVGEGSLEEDLRRAANDLGTGTKIIFTGGQKDVFRYYYAADLFVSTSVIEGFSLVHAEAMACGLPLVSTRTAGPDVMIKEGENGFFIASSTPGAVVEALERAISSDLERLGRRSLEIAEEFSIQETARRYENLVIELTKMSNGAQMNPKRC